MPRLIANMVGRNESQRYLVDVLFNLKQIVDLIVFTDDASTDDTPNIAETLGARVITLNESLFAENESSLRSLAWSHLSTFAEQGDWILAIDADEILYGIEHLPGLMDQSRYDVLGITFFHMWTPDAYRIDKAWTPNIGSRLFRFYPGGEFLKRKLACGSEPTYVQELIRQGRVMWNTGLKMKHLGYMNDVDKVIKHTRYMNLDGGDYHSRTHIESIVDAHPVLAEWSFEQ